MLTYKINIKNQERKKALKQKQNKKNEQDEERLWNFIFF